ncbi:hypothetical protein [Paenibacillus sp. FSL R5-0701]|uniref:hypothetical protein n=1 Tax=Paenibacillus sp. FSL R5-0701 TaxID=2921654 RepID=UPI000F94AED8
MESKQQLFLSQINFYENEIVMTRNRLSWLEMEVTKLTDFLLDESPPEYDRTSQDEEQVESTNGVSRDPQLRRTIAETIMGKLRGLLPSDWTYEYLPYTNIKAYNKKQQIKIKLYTCTDTSRKKEINDRETKLPQGWFATTQAHLQRFDIAIFAIIDKPKVNVEFFIMTINELKQLNESKTITDSDDYDYVIENRNGLWQDISSNGSIWNSFHGNWNVFSEYLKA